MEVQKVENEGTVSVHGRTYDVESFQQTGLHNTTFGARLSIGGVVHWVFCDWDSRDKALKAMMAAFMGGVLYLLVA